MHPLSNTVFLLIVAWLSSGNSLLAQTTSVYDDFEGNGNIATWVGDDCGLNLTLANPVPDADNPSATVLSYHDTGGQYANVRFEVGSPFLMADTLRFRLQVYVPAGGLTGNQPHQVSLKLQDGTLAEPWTTQAEIIKPINLDQWQTLTFDFATDPYLNLDPASPPPLDRTDFNRVVIQVNGENNNDHVLAYFDEVAYESYVPATPVYDQLVWADEFEVDGAIDADKWFHQTQLPIPGSWYNGEIQHYTDRIENAVVENGHLRIVARRETFTDQGYTKQFTSARLNSKFAFTYGRVEIRAKLPAGPGTWPAMWMLGKNIEEPGAYWQQQGFGTTSWPACGEIDIMEHWGSNQDYVSSAIHTPSSFGGTVNVGGRVLPNATTEFHDYSMIWTPENMIFQVDGFTHYVYEPELRNPSTWPFDADQYLLLNVAILPEIAANFTSSALEIDYVRVYQAGSLAKEEELEQSAALLYPQPVGEEARIRLAIPPGVEVPVQLYGLDGKLLLRRIILSEQDQLSLPELGHLPPGLYLLRYEWNQQSYQLRLMKQ
jgi:beta-glucanase (GH16 family)